MTALRSSAPAAGRTAAPARAAAGLALASAVVHLLLLDGSSLASLAGAAMALACLPCAWNLWRRPTPAVWAMAAAVDGGMLVLHVQTLGEGQPEPGMTAMAHTGISGPLMWAALALVGGQLALAGAVAASRR